MEQLLHLLFLVFSFCQILKFLLSYLGESHNLANQATLYGALRSCLPPLWSIELCESALCAIVPALAELTLGSDEVHFGSSHASSEGSKLDQ